MKLSDHISLIASGDNGLSMTNVLDCNVYLVDTGEGLLMIDAGAGVDNDAIEREMIRDGYRLADVRWIVITHAHADHAVGAPAFAAKCGAEIVTSPHEADVLSCQELLERTMEEYIAAGFYPAAYRFPVMSSVQTLQDGERLELGDVSLQALVTPGHTGGCLCLYGKIDDRWVLFSGDVVFFDGYINLISIFDVDLLGYKQSMARLAALEVDMLLPGHRQPLLRRGGAAIQKAAAAFKRFGVPPSIC